jgi:ABC-type transport system involved in multi-copper enzyme maturation permease subunit
VSSPGIGGPGGGSDSRLTTPSHQEVRPAVSGFSGRQLAGVMRLELKKTFFSRRAWWAYLLALAPAGLTLMHTLVELRLSGRLRGHTVVQDSRMFAAMYQTYFLHLGIFFGCVGIFSNLFRGEMLEKTLHYYFLTPLRREVLVAGKYLTGVLIALILFVGSVLASFVLIGYHQGGAWSDFLLHGAGFSQVATYAMVAALAVLGYGAVFLASGLLVRNPMIPAAAVWVWENLNPFLPSFLKKVSIIFYLKNLSPVNVLPDIPGAGGNFFSFLATEAEPAPAWMAVTGLLVVTLLILTYTAVSARRAEINYSE